MVETRWEARKIVDDHVVSREGDERIDSIFGSAIRNDYRDRVWIVDVDGVMSGVELSAITTRKSGVGVQRFNRNRKSIKRIALKATRSRIR